MRTAVQPAAPVLADTSADVYFRRVLESQPVCLTRIAEDGTFLAVNDAAMSLLGVEQLDQILDTSLLTLLAPNDREPCLAFLKRITNGDRGSTEVDLTGLAGLRHTLQIHAVTIPGSPDSLPAAFCTFRDITEHRRLERALMDAATREEEQASALSGERERLNAALAETRHAATAATASAADQARTAALEAALADAESRHRDLTEQHAARQAQLLADFETAQQQFESSLAAQLATLSATETALRAAEARERELTSQVSGGEQTWKAALDQQAAEHEIQQGALRQSLALLEASLAEAAAREQTFAAEQAQLRASFADATAARDAEARALRESVAELEHAVKEADQGRDEAVSRYDADRAAWEARQADATASIAALRQEIETLEAMQSAFGAERESLQRAAADADAARAELTTMLASAAAERSARNAEIRALERNARGGRLAMALAGDLQAALAAGTDRGRFVLGALAPGEAARDAAEQWLASTLEAGSIARRIRRHVQTAAPPAVVGHVVRTLEPTLGSLLGADVSLSVLVGSEGARVDLSADQLEQLLLTFVVHRRSMLRGGGQVSLEIADVELDEACGRERAASPGAYVLLALHVAGSGVDGGLPAALFDAPGVTDVWRAAGPGLAGVLEIAQSAGGHAWAMREGPEAVTFEVYLPRIEPGADEVAA